MSNKTNKIVAASIVFIAISAIGLSVPEIMQGVNPQKGGKDAGIRWATGAVGIFTGLGIAGYIIGGDGV